MANAATLLQRIDEVLKDAVVDEGASTQCIVDARQILKDYAASTDVHMPHFRVAHLSVG